jgi:ribosomal-protein-alanine N-acetyltransferase
MNNGLKLLSSEHATALAEIDQLATHWPWSAQQYRESFAAGNLVWGISQKQSRQQYIQAFAVYQQVLDEATLMNLVVHPKWQRQGFAYRLLQKTLATLYARGIKCCFLEVRESNLAAIRLYEKTGFSIDGQRKNYYPAHDGRETALLMSCHLPCATND